MIKIKEKDNVWAWDYDGVIIKGIVKYLTKKACCISVDKADYWVTIKNVFKTEKGARTNFGKYIDSEIELSKREMKLLTLMKKENKNKLNNLKNSS